MKKTAFWCCLLALGLLATTAAYAYYGNFIYTHNHWSYSVQATGFRELAGLSFDADGQLLVTDEGHSGKGSIIRIGANGSRLSVLKGLNEPDLVRFHNNRLYFSEEQGDNGVSYIENGNVSNLFQAENIEGFDFSRDNRFVYAVEDNHSGRLLKYDVDTHRLTVLAEGLAEPEGVCVSQDYVYYTEKAGNRLNRIPLTGGQPQTLAVDVVNPAALLCDQLTDDVWIAEERQNFGRLLRFDGNNLETVASLLGAPQEMLLVEGGILVADQRRGTVFRLSR
jgi:hypothetical protein